MNDSVKVESKKTIISTVKQKLSNIDPALRISLITFFLIAFAISMIQYTILILLPYRFIPSLIFGVAFIVVALIVAALITLILAALKRINWAVAFVFFASAVMCIFTFNLALFLVPLFIFGMAAVYIAAMCAKGRYKAYSKPKRIFRYVLLGLFSVLTLILVFLILWPGPTLSDADRPEKATLALPYAANVSSNAPLLNDPSIPGTYAFTKHYYAPSGQKLDPYPGEYTIPASTADASKLLEGWSAIRKQQLGFGSDALPLNAQVWMPEGTGPFPLTLIVHGNHDSGDRSDGGYAYLGELLASRGIIAASIDQNFLNSSALYDMFLFAELQRENGVRGFVLLEHLRQWYEWNADPSSQFYNKVDFDNLALIGHSRGGEAAAIAAAFSQLDYYPGNGMVRFDYPFQIKTVVAIAPSHNQYLPAGLELNLKNVNYLVLHGGHDMDVSSFMGANIYRRVDVSEVGIKSQVWIQSTNHGQFNSSWGVGDSPGLSRLSFNEKMMIPMAEQQQVAKVFISAFLESTLHGRSEYNALFRDFSHGADWLPPVLYVTDYADSEMTILDHYDGSFDLGSSSSKTVSYSAQGFDNWTIAELPGKWDNSNRALTLEWGSKDYEGQHSIQTPTLRMEFVEDTISIGDKLYVSLCSGNKNPDEENLSFDIRLIDSNGNTAILNINNFGGVVNPIDAPIVKPLASLMIDLSEPVLQIVCIQTEQFNGLSGDIISMDWIFTDFTLSKSGKVLYIDDLRVEKNAYTVPT